MYIVRLFCLALTMGILSSSAHAGSVTIIKGHTTLPSCGDFKQITQFGNTSYTINGKACRQFDKSWVLYQDEGAMRYEARGAFRPHMVFSATPPDTAQGTCQNFEQTTFIGIHAQKSKGKACQQPDGSWLMGKTGNRGITYRIIQDQIYLMPLHQDFQLEHEVNPYIRKTRTP